VKTVSMSGTCIKAPGEAAGVGFVAAICCSYIRRDVLAEERRFVAHGQGFQPDSCSTDRAGRTGSSEWTEQSCVPALEVVKEDSPLTGFGHLL